MSRRTFGWALAAVALCAFGVRVAYVLIERRDFAPGGDAFFYHAGANLLADGKGFISPFFPKRHLPAAEHPPAYLVYLAIPSVLGMKSVLTHMLWSCMLGTATVVLTGLVGREVGGARVGIGAAVVAALYPNMWAPDGMLEAETLAMFLATLAVLLAYRYRTRPTWPRVALLGAVCGLATLTRSELFLLVPFVVVPVALGGPARERRARLLPLGAGVLAALIVIAPWAGYNATRFKHTVFLSAQIGPLLSSANCDSTYYGAFRGYFDINCTIAADKTAGMTDRDDESQEDLANRRAAWDYVRGHLSKLPEVEAVRVTRILGLYHPSGYITIDTFVEGRERWVASSALYSLYVIELLAVAGAIVLRRRRVTLYPLLAPPIAVIFTVLVTYASTRFRAAAEPVLVVLAVVAVDAALTRLFARHRDEATVELDDQQAAPVSGATIR